MNEQGHDPLPVLCWSFNAIQPPPFGNLVWPDTQTARYQVPDSEHVIPSGDKASRISTHHGISTQEIEYLPSLHRVGPQVEQDQEVPYVFRQELYVTIEEVFRWDPEEIRDLFEDSSRRQHKKYQRQVCDYVLFAATDNDSLSKLEPRWTGH